MRESLNVILDSICTGFGRLWGAKNERKIQNKKSLQRDSNQLPTAFEVLSVCLKLLQYHYIWLIEHRCEKPRWQNLYQIHRGKGFIATDCHTKFYTNLNIIY